MWAAALVLAAGGSAPWLVGAVTEQQWRQTSRTLSEGQPLFELATEQYDRHYRGAEVRGTLLIEHPQTGEAMVIPYQAEVSHGLWGSEFRFTTASGFGGVGTELFPRERPSLVLDTKVWGTVLAELNVPAVSLDDPDTGESLTMAESYGWAEIRDGGRQLKLDLRWPGLTLRGPGVRVILDDLRLSQRMTRVVGDVWVGGVDVRMTQLELVDDARPAVALENLTVTSETTTGDEGRRLSSRSALALENVTVDDGDLGPNRLAFELVDAEVTSWQRLLEALAQWHGLTRQAGEGASIEQLERQMGVMAQFSEALRQLAGSGISFGVPELRVQTPAGVMTGSLAIRHPQLGDAERQQMLMVMPGLSGELDFSLPADLVARYPALWLQLQPAIEQGLLVREGDRYRIDARLQGLELDINGQRLPLPPLI